MESHTPQICPWCQTEIVWDPEIGPEDECPHCLNDLGAYRTIRLTLDSNQTFPFHEEGEDEDESGAGEFDIQDPDETGDLLDDYDDNGPECRDEYELKAEQCIDSQAEAPECGNCRELMLFAGHRTVQDFVPAVPAPLGKPFLTVPFKVDVYICPSCFKTEQYLSQDDRQKMINAMKG